LCADQDRFSVLRMSDPLFSDVDPHDAGDGRDEAPVRYETANRTQIELHPCDLEALLPPGHAARLVWRFVEGLDLSAFYATIRAREGRAGRSPIDPKILVALWLYATIDGVGSAREVDRLCVSHDAYRWLRGGVRVGHHTLSDFRTAHQGALDDLLTQSIAVLRQRDVITLARVAHDGTRVRGSAGAGSFRRGATLDDCLREARQQVVRTAKQMDSPGPTRAEAAQRRAAADRLARVEEAIAQLPAVQAIKDRQTQRETTRQRRRDARVSTTDPDARVMKMADGGYRPAYNVQFATDMASRAIVGVGVTNVGNDYAEFLPMLTQVARRTGCWPAAAVVDAGVSTTAAITALAEAGVTVYAPVPTRRGVRDPTARCRGDSDAVAAWRARMATDQAKAIYKRRGSVAEWVNADARTHRSLGRIGVRGLAKVQTWVLWVALAHNVMRAMAIIPHLMT
jgi:transposase